MLKTRETVVNTGDGIDLTIEAVNHNGDGVGRYEGLTVFVPQTVPGEKVYTRITELKKNFALGRVEKITEFSEKRVEPLCKAFSTCGGSRLQHIDYKFQLELKRKMVEGSLARIGKITDAVVNPTLGMDNPWAYRNKAQFQVSQVDGEVRLGFFEEGSHELASTTECLLLDNQIRKAAGMLEKMLNEYQVPVYNWETGKGLLRHVVIRRGLHPEQIMIVLVTSDQSFPKQFALAEKLKGKVPQLASVIRNINISRTRQVFGKISQLLVGQHVITDQLGGLRFTISPTSFFQVNPLQTEVLYNKAVEYAGLTGKETVLDVYCGIGTIALLMAAKAGRVVGFEVSAEAVRDAEGNALANRITNAEFISGRAGDRLPKLVQEGIRPDVVVIDPPRQGVEKSALQAIADIQPQRIVYISCDPATMARDLQFLAERSYKLQEVQPVDMFPQTSHVESVALLVRGY